MTLQVPNSESTPVEATRLRPVSRSLSMQIRGLMLDCPSRQAFYEKVLEISSDRFHASVSRVDFRVGDAIQEQMTHDVKMRQDLAVRFSSEYLKPLAESVLQSGNSEPQMKRFERGNQSLTLIAAPVMNIVENKATPSSR